jgi:DUF1680 family protein
VGRRIENKRVISNDRVRKERKQKNKIIIAVEGKNKTEKLYFNYKESTYEKENITLIPYYKSCNRGENEMSVYIRIKE